MPAIAVQYLEDSPELASIAPLEAQARLRAAFRVLPISCVLIGWNLPDAILDACAEETARAGAKLYRWHPLLTGDGTFSPRPEWQTVGLDGNPVPGFQDKREFTFVCPNHPQAQEAILDHVHDRLGEQRYSGFFLDRIRYPSPALDPGRYLACFCPNCQRAAREHGIDLEDLQHHIQSLLSGPRGAYALVDQLLGDPSGERGDADVQALRRFLRFRADTVTRFVGTTSRAIRANGREVGLDCFSPALTWMVGQDLAALDAQSEWIKIMSYGHTMGPAGLPFELLGLANWLVDQYEIEEEEALSWLSRGSGLALPSTRKTLCQEGLTPQAMAAETRRARSARVSILLAGIELVDLEGITRLNEAQITQDLRAFQSAGAHGLVLSWDLLHIPLERLEHVRRTWNLDAI